LDTDVLRQLIRDKLEDGRLPYNSIPRVWGGKGAGEICDACEESVTPAHLVMEGVSTDMVKRAVQFHVGCFYLWDVARRDPSAPR
jgi:hypothetical protein